MSDKPPTNLYTALLTAQRAMGPVLKNATNPHLKSKYADLGSVLDTIQGPLRDHGLIVVQRFANDHMGAVLVTELIHAASGECLVSDMPITCKDPADPQKIGAAITYYRRYSLLALLGLAPEDDDGHAASQPTPPARQSRTPQPPAQPTTRPAAGPPAGGPPLTAEEYEAVIVEAWRKQGGGATYPELVGHMREYRARFTPDQYEDSVEEMKKLKRATAPAAPASIAG